MATISLEERAEKFASEYLQTPDGFYSRHDAEAMMINCAVEIAIEQDRIARAEERERCIKAVQDAWCKDCRAYCTRHGHTGSCIEYEEDCKEFNLIRKAMEGG